MRAALRITYFLLFVCQLALAQSTGGNKKELQNKDFYALKVNRYAKGLGWYNSEGKLTLRFPEDAFIKGKGVIVLVHKQFTSMVIIRKDGRVMPYIINETFDNRSNGVVVWIGFGATDTKQKWDIIYHVPSADVTTITFINKVTREAYLYSGKLQEAEDVARNSCARSGLEKSKPECRYAAFTKNKYLVIRQLSFYKNGKLTDKK